MLAPISLARRAALCAALLILWGADGRAWAESDEDPVPVNDGGCQDGGCRWWGDCTPKAKTFGHYQPGWRKWPGEPRPDQTFPQSIGREPVPTPPGEEEVPLPVEVLPPEDLEPEPTRRKPSTETTLPTEGVFGPTDILPPDREIRIEDRSPLEQPGEKPGPLEPPEGDMLPGTRPETPSRLPLETPPAESPPRLPLETPPAESPSRLPLEMPPAKTSPRLPLEVPPAKTSPGLPAMDVPPAETPPKLPLEPVTPRRKELPAEQPRPAPSGSGASPDRSALPTRLDRLVGGQAVVVQPEDVREVDLNRGAPPAAQDRAVGEKVPVATEPWAEPRPWRPEPTGQATHHVEPRPASRPWIRPFEPRIEPSIARQAETPVQRPVEPKIERPLASPFQPPVQPKVEPPVEPPVEPKSERPLVARFERPVQPGIRQPFAPKFERPVQARFEQPVEPKIERRAPRPFEQPALPPPVVDQQSLGLDGYCPVRLAESEQWAAGDPRWAVSYQGRTYQTSGPEEQRRFLTNPGRYAPVLSGQDPVLALDETTNVPGQTQFCVVYEGRLYMFSSAATLARFHQNPKRYSAQVLQRTP